MLQAAGYLSLILSMAFFSRLANSQCTAPPEIKAVTDFYTAAGNGTDRRNIENAKGFVNRAMRATWWQ